MKQCPKCKATVSDTAKFCVKCGFNIKKHEEENAKHFCPECGTEFSGGNFCPECGYDITNDLEPQEAKPQKKTSKKKVIDFDEFDLDDVSSLLDKKIKIDKETRQLEMFSYEEHKTGGYIIKKFIDTIETNVIVPDGVVGIADGAFEKSLVISVQLPESLKIIGKRAFADCKYLCKMNIPNNLNRIDDEAFINCVNLDINIPKNISIIGKDILKNTLTLVNEKLRIEQEKAAKEKALALKKAKALEELKEANINEVIEYAKIKAVLYKLPLETINEGKDTASVNKAKKNIIKLIDQKVLEREEREILVTEQQRFIKELKLAAKKKVVCYESSYTKEIQNTANLKELNKKVDEITKKMDDIVEQRKNKPVTNNTSKTSNFETIKTNAINEIKNYANIIGVPWPDYVKVFAPMRNINDIKAQIPIVKRQMELDKKSGKNKKK